MTSGIRGGQCIYKGRSFFGKLLVLVIVSTLLWGGVTWPDRPGLAQETALVQLRLAPIQTIKVGEEVVVEVVISRVNDLGGVDLRVNFDPDMVELVTPNNPIQLNGAILSWYGPQLAQGNGWVQFVAVTAGQVGLTVGSEPVLLATIRFRLLAMGATSLELVVNKVAARTGGMVIPATVIDTNMDVAFSGDPLPLARELTISSTQDLAVTRPARIRAAAAEAVTWQVEITGPNGFPGLPERQVLYQLQAPELDLLWPVPPDTQAPQQPWNRVLPPGNYQIQVSARDDQGQEHHWEPRVVSIYNYPLRLQGLKITQSGQPPGNIKWGLPPLQFLVSVTASNLESTEVRPWVWLLARRGNELPLVLGFKNKTETDKLAGQQDNTITFSTQFYGTTAPGFYELSVLAWSESSPFSGGVPLAPGITAGVVVVE